MQAQRRAWLVAFSLVAACDHGVLLPPTQEIVGAAQLLVQHPTAAPVVTAAPTTSTAEAASSSASVRSPLASGSLASPTPLASAAVARRCPTEMADVGRYCIDRWEAHLVAPGAITQVHPHNLHPLTDVTYEARSAPSVLPQAHVSREQANSACRTAGKRLCAWIEWRRACQGSKWMRWPYGNARQEGMCNKGKAHLLMKLFGDDPNKWSRDDFNDPRLNTLTGFLARTGAHEGCVSPDGAYDMVGNLHEWVVDTVSSQFLRKMKEENMQREWQPDALGNGMFLGGFYSTRSEHGQGCFFTTVAHSARYYDYSTGFRCCKDAAAPPL